MRRAETGRVIPSSRRAVAALAVTVVLWASAFPAIRVAVAGYGPLGLSLLRLAIASVALLAVTPFARVRRPAARDLPLILLAGFFGMTAYQLLLNTGERTINAPTASLLVATTPIYSTLIAARVLGERVRARRWLGITIGFAGSAEIALAHGPGLEVSGGALVVLGAAVAQAVYHVTQKPLLARYSGQEVATYAMWAGTALALPLAWPAVHAVARAGGGGAGAALAALFLGLGPSALGFVTWAYAGARLDVGHATASLYLVPVVTIAISFLWLGELPRPLALVGGAIAVGGVALASPGRRYAEAAPSGRGHGPLAAAGRLARVRGAALPGGAAPGRGRAGGLPPGS
jgi:drug/metabolite transporter (DMT)-like permease